MHVSCCKFVLLLYKMGEDRGAAKRGGAIKGDVCKQKTNANERAQTNACKRTLSEKGPKNSADRTRGRRKGATSKNVKIVKKCQKYFRHFSTIFAQGKNRQKSSKNVKNIFDTFRQFSRGPFWGAPKNADKRAQTQANRDKREQTENQRTIVTTPLVSHPLLRGLESWAWLSKFCSSSQRRKALQNPPAQPQRFCRILGGGVLGAWAHLLRTGFNWRSHFWSQNCGQIFLRTRGLFRVVGRQNEVCTKDLIRATKFFKKMLRYFPWNFWAFIIYNLHLEFPSNLPQSFPAN